MGSPAPDRVRLRHRLEALAAGALLRLLGAAGPRVRYALAGRLGAAARLVDRRHYHHARESLALRYGAGEAPGLARGVFRELGHLVGEIPLLEQRDPERLKALIEAVEGGEHIQTAAADARGTLVLGAHLGNWELLGHLLPQLGLAPLHVVYRPLDNPLLEERLRASRERHGARAIARNQASRPVMQALRSGEAVAMLMDQFTKGPGTVRLPFLGEETTFSTAMARFAQRTASPILPVALLRQGPERFRMVAMEPIEPGRFPVSEAGALELTAAVVAAMEAQIARAPAQWFWVHRRWRGRPRQLIPGAPPPPVWGGETPPRSSGGAGQSKV